jgi:single-strand DNA-binding protein
MLNQVVIMGRITKDIETKTVGNDLTIVNFSVAVDRKFQKKGEDKKTDFLNCTAFGKTADFINQYFGKGRMIAITGEVNTDSYEKDGKRIYKTFITVGNVSFTGEKNSGSSSNENAGFEPISDDSSNDLPFK